MVFVLAECVVAAEGVEMPQEIKEKMNGLGYAVKFPKVIKAESIAMETSHHFIENGPKMEIAANIYRKMHRKPAKEKKPLVCPHCNKEAWDILLT